MQEDYPEHVKKALKQLAEIDAIIFANSKKRMTGYDPYSSLVNQKAGLMVFITAQMPGQVAYWTGSGYRLRDLRPSESGEDAEYFDEEEQEGEEE